MSEGSVQRMLLRSGLGMIPPAIRQDLYEDASFFAQWGISTTRMTLLGDAGPAFKRNELYDAIRSLAFQRGEAVSIKDEGNRTWELLRQLDGDTLTCQLKSGDQIVTIKDLSPLGGDPSVRASWINRLGRENNLDAQLIRKWVERLHASALADDEYDDLLSDIARAPVYFSSGLEQLLHHKNFCLDDLVPSDPKYFEALAGSLGGASTASDFIEAGATKLVRELNSKRSTAGLRFALLLCTSSLISKNIDLGVYEKEQVRDTFSWLVDNGDPISSIAAIEVGLRQLDIYPCLESYIERLVNRFLVSHKPSDSLEKFALFSEVAKAIAWQLWRKKTLHSAPPFYKRHVALTQASLVCRLLLTATEEDKESILRWILQLDCSQSYFLQALVDLRIEPRWFPEFIEPEQQLAEFAGRAKIAATSFQESIASDSLRNLLLEPSSLAFRDVPFPKPFLPGPLEGAAGQAQPCPDELLEKIKAALTNESLSARSFAILVNSALVFSTPKSIADSTAAALKRIEFALDEADIEQVAFSLLNGLATVSATSRSTELANSLRVLTRIMRRRGRLKTNPVVELRFTLIAAAAFEDLDSWARFAGDWLTEIAFELDDRRTAGSFLFQLQSLIRIEPILALYCSKACAAAESFSM